MAGIVLEGKMIRSGTTDANGDPVRAKFVRVFGLAVTLVSMQRQQDPAQYSTEACTPPFKTLKKTMK